MLSLIFLRMWRERRVMLVLLLSICLVSIFLALGPLYVQAIAGADFDQRIENAPTHYFSMLIRNEQPLNETVPSMVETEMADYVSAIRGYRSANSFSPGSAYQYDDAGERLNLPVGSWYRAYAYDSIETYFRIVDGRLPEIIQNANDESLAQVETVLTVDNANSAGLSIGDYISYGLTQDAQVKLLIVGIVEPILPENHPFWLSQTVLHIFLTPTGNENVRPDVSLIVLESDYEGWMGRAIFNTNYFVQADIERNSLSSLRLEALESSITSLNNQLSLLHPNVSNSLWLATLIEAYHKGIASAQGPITLLSFLVMVLMLYNIVTTASLILEQQGEEWAMISSRGGSALQLVGIQFVTVLLLGLVAAVLSPFLAYGVLLLLSFVGPQAEILDAGRLGGINNTAILLSSLATSISVIVLTLPAYPAARRSLSRLKAGLSRPPILPSWSRYFLDIVLLGLGIGFLVRLYSLNTEEGIVSLLRDPSSLVRVLSTQGGTGDFSDIFNLAAPALILVGASLFWMRLFPYLMRLFGAIFARGNGLTARLAFWSVERDPAHYAQLVLLLIGTLALGTASLALAETRESGAWEAAHNEVGADAVLALDPVQYDYTRNWNNFEGVDAGIPFLFVPTGNRRDGALIGVDYAAINAESFPEYAQALAPLQNQEELDFGGIILPENSQALHLDVLSAAFEDGDLNLELTIGLQDSLGTNINVHLNADSPQTGEFMLYEGTITEGLAPYRMMSLAIHSTVEGNPNFEHRVYMDNLRVLTSNGESILINSFEPDTYANWQWDRTARFSQVISNTAFANDNTLFTEGENSLRVLYLMQTRGAGGEARPALLTYRAVPLPPLPVVVNETFARNEGGRTRLRDSLIVGDSVNSRITVPLDETGSTYIQARLVIVGIIDDFPAFSQDAPVIIADLGSLRRQLNNFETFADDFGITLYYDVNRVWFDLAEREPSAAFIEGVDQVAGFQDLRLAWTRYTEIQREPLANSITGMLFAGFWISLVLSLIDFSFYMAVTIRRRALSFATLQAIGWSERNLLNLLLMEQLAFISPALLIGVVFGILLAYLILPFLSLVGALSLQIPIFSIFLLLVVLVLAFAIILRIAALALRRFSLNQVMRFGE